VPEEHPIQVYLTAVRRTSPGARISQRHAESSTTRARAGTRGARATDRPSTDLQDRGHVRPSRARARAARSDRTELDDEERDRLAVHRAPRGRAEHELVATRRHLCGDRAHQRKAGPTIAPSRQSSRIRTGSPRPSPPRRSRSPCRAPWPWVPPRDRSLASQMTGRARPPWPAAAPRAECT
jgi:hypothetical protein